MEALESRLQNLEAIVDGLTKSSVTTQPLPVLPSGNIFKGAARGNGWPGAARGNAWWF